MIIKVTNKCYMNCTHCMEDSSPDGEHMDSNTVADTYSFVKNYIDGVSLLISGGEPTLHPDIISIIKLFKSIDKFKLICLLSNGQFLSDKKLTNELLNLNIQIQVINYKKYYPTRIEDPKIEGIFYEDNMISKLSPFGRAAKNNLKCDRQSPLCFNTKSVAHYYYRHQGSGDLIKKASRTLEIDCQKLCSISIDVKGNIIPSECGLCTPIGHVTDDIDKLSENLIKHQCNKCGLYDNLDDFHKNQVNYHV